MQVPHALALLTVSSLRPLPSYLFVLNIRIAKCFTSIRMVVRIVLLAEAWPLLQCLSGLFSRFLIHYSKLALIEHARNVKDNKLTKSIRLGILYVYVVF